MITNMQSGTNIEEIASGVYRINTPFPEIPGGFSFNQYLVVDDEPLLFHTGMRRTFPLVTRRSAGSCPSTGCATSRSPILNRTNAVR